jgi:hypothetical protein
MKEWSRLTKILNKKCFISESTADFTLQFLFILFYFTIDLPLISDK